MRFGVALLETGPKAFRNRDTADMASLYASLLQGLWFPARSQGSNSSSAPTTQHCVAQPSRIESDWLASSFTAYRLAALGQEAHPKTNQLQ